MYDFRIKIIALCCICLGSLSLMGQGAPLPRLEYTVSVSDPDNHVYRVEMELLDLPMDTLVLQLPNWMPGYYQMMDYHKGIQNFRLHSGTLVDSSQAGTWVVTKGQGEPIKLEYGMLTHRTFVANSFVDRDRAYIVPVNSFLFVEGHSDLPMTLTLKKSHGWTDVATGLERTYEDSKKAVFVSDDLDAFMDSPLLMGKLDKLPEFHIDGIPHRFWGHAMGEFDRQGLMDDLKATIKVATDLIGHIPYTDYTFIGIGPGRGGIEHLNSSTVSFSGKGLDDPQAYLRMMEFLAHEYFHHYNVKRIRPFELGPFDYRNGSKTTQLWISEGLTSYYASLMVRRAGISSQAEFLQGIAAGIGQFENNPGKAYQSLIESSFETWQEGPFGKSGKDPDKSISYYVKGPIVGLLMDFGIRHATDNQKSLDDVMRYLYHSYYLEMGRGFTDAEFRNACTTISGDSLTELFQYVYTPKPLDYTTYLGYAGLELERETKTVVQKDSGGNPVERIVETFSLHPIENPTPAQKALLDSWMGRP